MTNWFEHYAESTDALKALENEMLELLISLDKALTGKDDRTIRTTASHQLLSAPGESADKWESDRYYLSDGGYSRIEFLLHHWDETGEPILQLASESTAKAKARWDEPEVRALRESLLGVMRVYLAKEEELFG